MVAYSTDADSDLPGPMYVASLEGSAPVKIADSGKPMKWFVSDKNMQSSIPTGPDQTVAAHATAPPVSTSPTIAKSAPPAPTPTIAKASPVANTRTAAARLFVQALLAGDVSGALARMSVAAQSVYSSMLPGMASALAPCAKSVMEVTYSQTNYATVRFTPRCGDNKAVYQILYPVATNVQFNIDMAHWLVGVALVNEEWKVTQLSIGL